MQTNTQQTKAFSKEQTAFRFDPVLIQSMKRRAKSMNISVNKYVTDLIEKDLKDAYALPKVKLPVEFSEDIVEYSGIIPIPSEEELMSDERLERIWRR